MLMLLFKNLLSVANLHVFTKQCCYIRDYHFCAQCIYNLREAHEIFVTGLEFAPNSMSRAIVGPNVDFTLFSISADSQVKAHQVESRRTFLFMFNISVFSLLW